MLAYVDGHFVPQEQASVSVLDHGFLYGDGIYETMRAYDGRIFLLKKHMTRLKSSARSISLKLPMPVDQIAEALEESLNVNKLRNAYLRLHISRGPGPIGLDPALCPVPSMIIIVQPFREYPQQYYAQGVRVAIVGTRRNHPLALPPSIKSTNFLNNILAKIEAKKRGAYEGIMLNWQGYVAEGTISNIFMVRKSAVYTPHVKTGILAGVTRDLVIRLARRKRLRVEEILLDRKKLMAADECFITNSTLEVMPVTKIDATAVGSGKPGPITGLLHLAYQKEVQRCSTTQANWPSL